MYKFFVTVVSSYIQLYPVISSYVRLQSTRAQNPLQIVHNTLMTQAERIFDIFFGNGLQKIHLIDPTRNSAYLSQNNTGYRASGGLLASSGSLISGVGLPISGSFTAKVGIFTPQYLDN